VEQWFKRRFRRAGKPAPLAVVETKRHAG